MKHTRKQKEAELLSEAQSVIEEFLDWEEQTAKPNLTQIEDIVLRLRERLGQRMAAVAIDDQDAKQPVEAPACSDLWRAAALQGQKDTEVASRIGEIDLERGHYYCARASGLFPWTTN